MQSKEKYEEKFWDSLVAVKSWKPLSIMDELGKPKTFIDYEAVLGYDTISRSGDGIGFLRLSNEPTSIDSVFIKEKKTRYIQKMDKENGTISYSQAYVDGNFCVFEVYEQEKGDFFPKLAFSKRKAVYDWGGYSFIAEQYFFNQLDFSLKKKSEGELLEYNSKKSLVSICLNNKTIPSAYDNFSNDVKYNKAFYELVLAKMQKQADLFSLAQSAIDVLGIVSINPRSLTRHNPELIDWASDKHKIDFSDVLMHLLRNN